MTVRVVGLAVLALLLEAGWLALWPLSGALSHSPAFTASFLESYPAARFVFGVTLDASRRLIPDLSATPVSDPLGAPVYVVPAIALATVMLFLSATYAGSLALLHRGAGVHRRAVVVIILGAISFQATLLFLPGLFSQDVFSYIAYGRLAAVYDLNPYVWPPSAIAKDEVVSWVADVWRTYASPYGPVWVDVQWLMARVCGSLSVTQQAMAYRLLADALMLVNLGLAWWLLGRLTPVTRAQRTTALAALAWNPLIVFELSANAHNDVLMISFSLLALVLLVRLGTGVPASASFALGTLVKYLSGVGLIWMGVAALAGDGSPGQRLSRLARIGVAAAILCLLVMARWLELPDSIEPLLTETTGVGYVNALPDSLAVAVAGSLAASVAGLDALRSLERVLVMAIFGIYLVWEGRRVWSAPTAAVIARACALSSLMYVLVVSTSVQTWYFCLPVAVATVLGCRGALTRVIIGYSLLALPALYLHYYLRDATPGWVDAVYGLVPLLPLAIPPRVAASGTVRA